MCGLSGIISTSPQENPLEALKHSIQAIAHRGPDFTSFHQQHEASFAHARLAVIDLDQRSNQPFLSKDGKSMLVFNGEIYNYKALRTALEAQGLVFSTEGDTEVLAEGLQAVGSKFIKQLQGCFAFAHYNFEQKELLLARDPMGIKPLWYTNGEDGSITFSSEVKGLLPFLQDPRLNPQALHEFLRFSYNSKDSIFEEFKSLEPGSLLRWKAGESSIEKYFDLKATFAPSIIQKNQQVDQLDKLLFEAVEKRLLSDVPLGAFLSGGLDSSLIAALAKQVVPNLKTYTIGFQGADFFDESTEAEASAKFIGSDHRSFKLGMDELEAAALNIGKNLGQPFGDASSVLVGLLAEKVKQEVSVALSGDGADELFAGYEKHRGQLMALQPNFALKTLARWSKRLPKGNRNSKTQSTIRKAQKFNEVLSLSKENRYHHLRAFASEQSIHGWTNSTFVPNYAHLDSGDELQEVLYNDQLSVLPGDMLTKVDLMSMRYALEVRVPFLDEKVLRFANSLPALDKFGKDQGKKILRELARRHLSPSILKRPKRGFELPLDQLLIGPLHHSLDACLDEAFTTYFQLNSRAIAQDLRAYRAGDKSLNSAFWNLHVLRTWWQDLLV
ncbi:MAG: asparagine synthase (glutamine-hydrolyzing) [Flavobacteriales bacterium]|nr:asparagine synthase (glutamine-hydrolyzing) [Flavobacteriales bacterium]